MSYNAIFNNYDLADADYFVSKINVGSPSVKVNKYELVRADGQIVTNQNYGERRITVEGNIKANSLEEMQQKLDTLKSRLVGIEKTLDVYTGDNAPRRYIATVEGFNYTTAGYFCEYTIQFTADSFGKELTTTALAFGTYTANDTSYPNTISGSYFAKPTIDFTVNNCIPYYNLKYIQFKNSVLSQRIRFTRQWGWGDRIIINGEEKTVSIYPSTITTIDDCESISGWTSSHTLSLETTDMIEGEGAHKLVMAGAAILLTLNRLNATAIDLSSTVGKVLIPVFIPTPSAGAVSSIDFKIGSDATLASNFSYWRKTTQYNGSALATNAWNYIEVDLSLAATSTKGTPVRTAIKSIAIEVNGVAATMQLNGLLVDYISVYKPSIISEPLDYEGIFPELDLGSSVLTVEDDLTSRNITISGNYTKRYL